MASGSTLFHLADDLVRISADRADYRQIIYHVKASVASFVLGYKWLRLPEPSGQINLRESVFLPRSDHQIAKLGVLYRMLRLHQQQSRDFR